MSAGSRALSNAKMRCLDKDTGTRATHPSRRNVGLPELGAYNLDRLLACTASGFSPEAVAAVGIHGSGSSAGPTPTARKDMDCSFRAEVKLAGSSLESWAVQEPQDDEQHPYEYVVYFILRAGKRKPKKIRMVA